MYEWENEINKKTIESRKLWLRGEIRRICTVTLRGNFRENEDRIFWEKRVNKLNGELISLESLK